MTLNDQKNIDEHPEIPMVILNVIFRFFRWMTHG